MASARVKSVTYSTSQNRPRTPYFIHKGDGMIHLRGLFFGVKATPQGPGMTVVCQGSLPVIYHGGQGSVIRASSKEEFV